MHGRVKTKYSAEQEEAKKKEEAEKVLLYREVTRKIYEKRAAGDHDDEALSLTRNVLTQNPEITTFWNYRREILLERLETMSPEEVTQLFEDELSLLEHCLRVNPKAYCVWLHREWTTTHSPAPDWKREKELCDLFLKYDERNFHCWDYRRFVISKSSDVSPQDEFDFTYKKIAANFSNYSAWHYRSKILPKLHPSPDTPGCVAEEALLKEHELVQNAFFTDPSDQSAWFYQRWLLGKGNKSLDLVSVLFQREPQPIIYIAFNQPIKVSKSNPIKVSLGSISVTIYDNTGWPECVYSCSVPLDLMTGEEEVVIKVEFDHLETAVTLTKVNEVESWWVSEEEKAFGSSLTAATTTVLQTELSNCQELMELEPDNKWCILTVALLMEAIDGRKYLSEITDMLNKLCSVDLYRAAYYRDLMSKFVIEQILRVCLETFSPSNRTLSLANKELSQLYFLEHMQLYTCVDLSENRLTALQPNIKYLISLTELLLDDNQLEHLPEEMGELKNLRVLSLKNNYISELRVLEVLKELNHLECLKLTGNPLCQLCGEEELIELVRTTLPQIKANLFL